MNDSLKMKLINMLKNQMQDEEKKKRSLSLRQRIGAYLFSGLMLLQGAGVALGQPKPDSRDLMKKTLNSIVEKLPDYRSYYTESFANFMVNHFLNLSDANAAGRDDNTELLKRALEKYPTMAEVRELTYLSSMLKEMVTFNADKPKKNTNSSADYILAAEQILESYKSFLASKATAGNSASPSFGQIIEMIKLLDPAFKDKNDFDTLEQITTGAITFLNNYNKLKNTDLRDFQIIPSALQNNSGNSAGADMISTATMNILKRIDRLRPGRALYEPDNMKSFIEKVRYVSLKKDSENPITLSDAVVGLIDFAEYTGIGIKKAQDIMEMIYAQYSGSTSPVVKITSDETIRILNKFRRRFTSNVPFEYWEKAFGAAQSNTPLENILEFVTNYRKKEINIPALIDDQHLEEKILILSNEYLNKKGISISPWSAADKHNLVRAFKNASDFPEPIEVIVKSIESALDAYKDRESLQRMTAFMSVLKELREGKYRLDDYVKGAMVLTNAANGLNYNPAEINELVKALDLLSGGYYNDPDYLVDMVNGTKLLLENIQLLAKEVEQSNSSNLTSPAPFKIVIQDIKDVAQELDIRSEQRENSFTEIAIATSKLMRYFHKFQSSTVLEPGRDIIPLISALKSASRADKDETAQQLAEAASRIIEVKLAANYTTEAIVDIINNLNSKLPDRDAESSLNYASAFEMAKPILEANPQISASLLNAGIKSTTYEENLNLKKIMTLGLRKATNDAVMLDEKEVYKDVVAIEYKKLKKEPERINLRELEENAAKYEGQFVKLYVYPAEFAAVDSETGKALELLVQDYDDVLPAYVKKLTAVDIGQLSKDLAAVKNNGHRITVIGKFKGNYIELVKMNLLGKEIYFYDELRPLKK